MKKRGKKVFALASILILGILIATVMIPALNQEGNSQEELEIKEDISKKASGNISDQAYDYVQDFMKEKGVDSDKINEVSEVDFENLPEEVDINNIEEANLAVYQIDYNSSQNKTEKLFVITYAVQNLESKGDIIISEDKRELLTFGTEEELTNSNFLKSASGVRGSLEKGYVMIRKGSITGISTNLDSLGETGDVEIILYKNGKVINFGNDILISSTGSKKDYDLQSKETVVFEPGDIISAYARISGGARCKDITTLVEIVTE